MFEAVILGACIGIVAALGLIYGRLRDIECRLVAMSDRLATEEPPLVESNNGTAGRGARLL